MQEPQIKRTHGALHQARPRAPVHPLGRALAIMPQEELPVPIEEVREEAGEVGRAEQRERVRITAARERLQVLPERTLVLLQFLEAEDVARIAI